MSHETIAPADRKCCICGKTAGPQAVWLGANMWHTWQFTCQHETAYSCNECWQFKGDKYAACSQCGCGESYT